LAELEALGRHTGAQHSRDAILTGDDQGLAPIGAVVRAGDQLVAAGLHLFLPEEQIHTPHADDREDDDVYLMQRTTRVMGAMRER